MFIYFIELNYNERDKRWSLFRAGHIDAVRHGRTQRRLGVHVAALDGVAYHGAAKVTPGQWMVVWVVVLPG